MQTSKEQTMPLSSGCADASNLQRKLEILSEFRYDISHRAVKQQGNADRLSRLGMCLEVMYTCEVCHYDKNREGYN